MPPSKPGGGGDPTTTSPIVNDPSGSGWQQPPFDPRITYTPLLQYDPVSASGTLSHGYIREASGGGGLVGGGRYFRFLYNPASISVNHTVSTSDASYDPSLRPPTTDDGVVAWPTGASVAFELLFDRTYETSDTGRFSSGNSDAYTRGAELGVQVDINALYAICGILQVRSSAPGAGTQLAPTTAAGKAELIAQAYIRSIADNNLPDYLQQDKFVTQATFAKLNSDYFEKATAQELERRLKAANLAVSDLPTNEDPSILNGSPSAASTPSDSGGSGYGYMTIKQVVAVFGEQRGSLSGVLRYYGYISSLDITYTHFTQRMVPSRATVSLTLSLLPADAAQLDAITGVG